MVTCYYSEYARHRVEPMRYFGGWWGGGHIMAALTCATREYHLKKHRAVGVPKK